MTFQSPSYVQESLQKSSIPRLELYAALGATHANQYILSELDLPMDTVIFYSGRNILLLHIYNRLVESWKASRQINSTTFRPRDSKTDNLLFNSVLNAPSVPCLMVLSAMETVDVSCARGVLVKATVASLSSITTHTLAVAELVAHQRSLDVSEYLGAHSFS